PMIHVMRPVQYLRQPGKRLAEPEKRLALAVLQTVLYDCRGAGRGGAHWPRGGAKSPGIRPGHGLRVEPRPELALQFREPVRDDRGGRGLLTPAGRAGRGLVGVMG